MAKNFNGTQINQTVTITEKAGSAITDARNLIMKYDSNGDVVPATSGAAPILGIAIIEAGYNDVSGAESGKVAAGDDVDIQIKDIGYVIAGGSISKGDEVTATTGGKAVAASSGDYVLGVALSDGVTNDYVRVQIQKYLAGGSGSGEVSVAMSDLTDVDLSTPATNGQVLKYDSSASKWKPAADATE